MPAFARHEGLKGKGAALGFHVGAFTHTWGVASENKLVYRFCPTWVNGDSDWTRLEVVTPAIPAAKGGIDNDTYSLCSSIQPACRHDGEGMSWFDDFAIEELDE